MCMQRKLMSLLFLIIKVAYDFKKYFFSLDIPVSFPHPSTQKQLVRSFSMYPSRLIFCIYIYHLYTLTTHNDSHAFFIL